MSITHFPKINIKYSTCFKIKDAFFMFFLYNIKETSERCYENQISKMVR